MRLDSPAPHPRVGHFRWVICALLFLATTINYMDRQVIGILKPTLMADLGWGEIDYSNVVFAFQAAYAIGYAAGGWFMDRVGVRMGLAAAVCLWSVAAVAHAFVRSVSGFSFVRAGLGLAEGGNFPAAVRTVSEWFPKQERALATGIFNAGSNVAVMLSPLVVLWLTSRYGWPAAFLVTGALGFFWLFAWLPVYRSPKVHPRLSDAERTHILSDSADPAVNVPWRQLLKYRQTWSFVAGMLLVSPVWWFYLFWVPGFLNKRHGLELLQLGPPLVVIYLLADVGSIGGGWLSGWLVQRGWSLNAARKTTMLVCALAVLPVAAASVVAKPWTAVLLIGLAAAAHQGFSANLYTLVSDTAPRFAVGSIVGIGGMAAGIGGMFNAKLTGYVLEWTGEYLPLFIVASLAYLVALMVIHWLNPRLEPMRLACIAPPSR
jgi:ACS family hexuronate transporter-like MFS transporter